MTAASVPVPAPYDRTFFDQIIGDSRRSAEVVVPLVLDIARPHSIIDVGCGTGTWLATFQRHGVSDIFGIDGPWVDTAALEIPPARFRSADLTQPAHETRKFDLAMSLETAEHIAEPSARSFVRFLTELSDLVVFSAAIPHQGGTSHVNEQWPQYWGTLFAEHGFAAIDCLRFRLWENPEVCWWYAQNMFLFVRTERLNADERLARLRDGSPQGMLPLVHPRKHLETVRELGVAASAAAAPSMRQLGSVVKRRVQKLAGLLPDGVE